MYPDFTKEQQRFVVQIDVQIQGIAPKYRVQLTEQIGIGLFYGNQAVFNGDQAVHDASNLGGWNGILSYRGADSPNGRFCAVDLGIIGIAEFVGFQSEPMQKIRLPQDVWIEVEASITGTPDWFLFAGQQEFLLIIAEYPVNDGVKICGTEMFDGKINHLP